MTHSPIARVIRSNPSAHDTADLRRLAWKKQGVLVVEVDRVKDALVHRVLTVLAEQLYGPRDNQR